jgi:hypothetical protein
MTLYNNFIFIFIKQKKTKMNILRLITEVLTSKQDCVSWCQGMGIIRNAKDRSKCGQQITIFDINRGIAGKWRCKNRSLHRGGREYDYSAADGTWFTNTKMSIEKCILVTYCWAKGYSLSFLLFIYLSSYIMKFFYRKFINCKSFSYEQTIDEVRLSGPDTRLSSDRRLIQLLSRNCHIPS